MLRTLEVRHYGSVCDVPETVYTFFETPGKVLVSFSVTLTEKRVDHNAIFEKSLFRLARKSLSVGNSR